MKKIFVLAALLMSTPAMAWDCLPAEWGGDGTPLHYDSNDGWGAWTSWACRLSDGTAQAQHWVSLYSVRPGAFTTVAMAAIAAKVSSVTAANALAEAMKVAPAAGSEATNFTRLEGVADAYAATNQFALLPAGTVAPVVVSAAGATKGWFIKPNGTAKTRQWYACAGCTDALGGTLGTRSTTGGGSVTIGTKVACDPAKAFRYEMSADGKTTYPYMAYGPTFNPARVTLCELQPL